MTFVTRFAPSPTGPLHLGHAYSAWIAHARAAQAGGTFLLRIEDIDQSRSRASWEDQIYDDLKWLGLTWPTPVLRQSDRMAQYSAALDSLWSKGLLYPCSCTRRDVSEAASAPQEGALVIGPDGIVYPGTCRTARTDASSRPKDQTLRLNMAVALQGLEALEFIETGEGPSGGTGKISISPNDLINGVGDIVVARKDMGTSYHLSVVVDDADQGVTEVVRGADLFEATSIHVLLQHLLNLPTPQYHHHRLIRDEAGKRLAKRDDARALAKYRNDGLSPRDVLDLIGVT